MSTPHLPAGQELFSLADDLGPEKILHVTEPAVGLRAIVVVDNTAAGPAIGGTRMAPDVSVTECFRLARAMTLKNALAGLPHGGAKSVIVGAPDMAPQRKEQIVRAFAQAIRTLQDYIPGPDMGTDETAMAWVKSEIGRAVGLPRVLGGIPLDEIGATGYGLAIAAEAAAEMGGPRIAGARVAIQGFGAVGQHAARFLAERGAVLVAASDSQGTLCDPGGLDVAALIALKATGGRLHDHGVGDKRPTAAIIGVDCDILIPAARPDVVTEHNVAELRTRMFLQGANIPATAVAERAMQARGILSIPDVIANAGGVICAAVEYRGGTQGAAFSTIAERISANTREMLRKVQGEGIPPREAADRMAFGRVRAAMATRRWHASD